MASVNKSKDLASDAIVSSHGVNPCNLLIHNARLFSSHDHFEQGSADCIAVDRGVIKEIGNFQDMQSYAGSNTKIIDANGRTLMPGFNDTHIHIWKVGNLKTLMLDVRAAKSLDEMLEMIQAYDRQYPEVSWITARGFNEAAWKDGRLPTREDLDRVVTHKPVYVIRTCAHIAVINTKALEICNISADVHIPDGGEMGRASNGQPNGIFSETALGLVSKHIPAYSKSQLKQMVRAGQAEMLSFGITAATDPAVDPLLLESYYEMYAAGELQIRLNAIPILLPDGGGEPFEMPKKFASLGFNVNTVKFFSDGGLSGKTSALKRTYKNSTEKGILRLNPEQYLRLCMQAMKEGLGVATHAIGDAAIEFVIAIYKKLNASFPDNIKRIEHLGLPEERHLEDMAKGGMMASMQSIFISELGKNFIRYLDESYLNHCYPVKSVLDHGIKVALSSDSPVVKNYNPFKGIEAAVTRTDNEGHRIAPDQAINVEDGLKAYTNSAAQISATPQFGTLEVGKAADFILLGDNPLTMAAEKLSAIQVDMTFVGGEILYENRL